MKRDMDLVRRILVNLEESAGPLEASLFEDERHDYQDVAYHFEIMEQAGLVKATFQPGDNNWYYAAVNALTWDGQDFLSAVKNDRVWKKVLMKVAKVAGDATFDMIKAIAVQELGKLLL